MKGEQAADYRLLNTAIPENVAIAEAFAHQIPVNEYVPSSVGALAYQLLAQEVAQTWDLAQPLVSPVPVGLAGPICRP